MKIIMNRTNRASQEIVSNMQKVGSGLVDEEVVCVAVTTGPDRTITYYDEGLIAREMFEIAQRAESEGFDAYIVGSCCDANERGLKEITQKMVVVEPGAAAMSVAAFLSDRFSVLCVEDPRLRSMAEASIQRLGISSKVASIRSFIPQAAGEWVDQSNREYVSQMAEAIADGAKKACDEDGAHAVILYSLSYAELGVVEPVKEILERDGYGDLLVIDPTVVCLNYARMLVSCGLKHSKLSFRTPMGPPRVNRVL